jgi:hypothetical protein
MRPLRCEVIHMWGTTLEAHAYRQPRQVDAQACRPRPRLHGAGQEGGPAPGADRGQLRARYLARAVAVASHEEGVRRLAAGEFAGYFGAASILIFQLAKSPDKQRLKLANQPLTFEPYALPLPRGDEDFRLLVDRTLARLYGSGEIERVFTAVFGAEARPPEFLKALYLLNAPPE